MQSSEKPLDFLKILQKYHSVAIFSERDSAAATWWLKPNCIVPGNVAAKPAACQQAAFCSHLATVQLVRPPSWNMKLSPGLS